MSLKIVRNNITNMETDAIVNTANENVAVGQGCDYAIYSAAGYDQLLEFRKNNIGEVKEGEVFVTPAFNLKTKYIIHVVSPRYIDGSCKEEEKLRSCYRKSLQLAKEYGIRTIAFPVISTGSFGYPKEEGLIIAVEEINYFLAGNEMEVFIVVFDDVNTQLGKKIYPDLEEYIDSVYVKQEMECPRVTNESGMKPGHLFSNRSSRKLGRASERVEAVASAFDEETYVDFEMAHGEKLNDRIEHIKDTFSEYLLYIIKEKNMTNAEVYNRALVSKKVFSKIKNNKDYHPQKLTALCLCVGAKLNMDETRDMLGRAGYALSPCDKTDIIFSYFIENEIYDMIELDIQLEEYGLPCILS